jgi:hypothetical protein
MGMNRPVMAALNGDVDSATGPMRGGVQRPDGDALQGASDNARRRDYRLASGPGSSGTFQPINSQPRKCGAPAPGVQAGQPQYVSPPSSGRKAMSHVFWDGSQCRP